MTQPTIQQSTNCDISIPDYTVMRQDKIKKINDYYAKLLDSYTTSYANYSKQSTSSNINDKKYAETSLKQNVADYNSQVINLSQTLINNVNQDTDLITDQKNILLTKTTTIDNSMDNIKLLKEKDLDMTVLSNARQDSLNSTTMGTENIQFTTYTYIGLCILIGILIIGMLIYIVYTGYSNSGNTSFETTNTKTNNSIKTNNGKTNANSLNTMNRSK